MDHARAVARAPSSEAGAVRCAERSRRRRAALRTASSRRWRSQGKRALFELAENVFVEESTVRFYGVRLQTRMAAIRLRDGRLLLYSPLLPTPTLRQTLERLGRVAFLVSPNKIHNQTLDACREAFPEAELHVPPGLPERRPALRFAGVLGDEPNPAWSDELDQALTGGNVFFSEVLFLHRHSHTLLVGDLIENLDARTASRTGRALASLFGVPERPAPSPEFRLYTHMADAAAAALDRVREWPFERIFLCHGGLIERDAKGAFDAVAGELLSHARGRSRLARFLLRHLAAWQ